MEVDLCLSIDFLYTKVRGPDPVYPDTCFFLGEGLESSGWNKIQTQNSASTTTTTKTTTIKNTCHK